MSEPRVYPEHVYDPLRRRIAEDYVRHELRKVFPSLRAAEAWERIDADVARWFDGQPIFAPVRDFWNAVDGISTGFRLKHIVPWVTSLHLSWEEADVPVDALHFSASFREFAPIGRNPSAASVRDWFHDPAHAPELAALRTSQDAQSSYTVARDAARVLVMPRPDLVEGADPLMVFDGNRRVLRAVTAGAPTVPAYVARRAGDPLLYEPWVPTSLLGTFVSGHRMGWSAGAARTKETARLVADLVGISAAGRYELVMRCLVAAKPADVALHAAVSAMLHEDGVALDPMRAA